MVIWDLDWQFRTHLEAATKGTLEAIGFRGEVEGALIGLRHSGDDATVILQRQNNTASQNVERAFRDIDIPAIESILKGRGDGPHNERPDYRHSIALQRYLNSSNSNRSWRYFLAPKSATVGDFSVYATLATTSVAIGLAPQLRRTKSDGTVATSSLVSQVIDEILRRSWLHLASDPNGYGMSSLRSQRFELVRAATATIVAEALDPTGLHGTRDSDLLLSSLSALPYEGRVGRGAIIVAAPDSTSIRVNLHLQSPVPIDRLHAVRKLMEVATEKTSLLLYQSAIYGIGEIDDFTENSDTELASIDFTGRNSWRLRQGERTVLQVKDGISQLPDDVDANIAGIAARVSWLFPEANVETLLRLARAARQNRHGAMLIISADAAEESRRLAPQAWAVQPTEISDEMMAQLTDMDGGVLVDPQGRCHAIGVILDGLASGTGDPGRGSRYNNPIRYLRTSKGTEKNIPNAVVVVYSTDGAIDILPPYPRKVEQALIKHLVARLIRNADVSTPDLNDLGFVLQALRDHQFYLSQRQCTDLNEALDRLDQTLTDSAIRDALRQRFDPDPRMDEDRFLS